MFWGKKLQIRPLRTKIQPYLSLREKESYLISTVSTDIFLETDNIPVNTGHKDQNKFIETEIWTQNVENNVITRKPFKVYSHTSQRISKIDNLKRYQNKILFAHDDYYFLVHLRSPRRLY